MRSSRYNVHYDFWSLSAVRQERSRYGRLVLLYPLAMCDSCSTVRSAIHEVHQEEGGWEMNKAECFISLAEADPPDCSNPLFWR